MSTRQGTVIGEAAATAPRPDETPERTTQRVRDQDQRTIEDDTPERQQQREQAQQQRLETAIQKTGAKVAPQEEEQIGHRKSERPEYDLSDLSRPAPPDLEPSQKPGGVLEMPTAKKVEEVEKAKQDIKAKSEEKLRNIVVKLETGKLDEKEKEQVAILIDRYYKGPRDEVNTNQVIAQIMNLSAAANPTMPVPVEANPTLLRPGQPDQGILVVETKPTAGSTSEQAQVSPAISQKMGEISSLLKNEKKTLATAVLAAKELTESVSNSVKRTPTKVLKDETPGPAEMLKTSAKAWIAKIISALSGKAPERSVASLPPSSAGVERDMASTPESRVDIRLQSVDGSMGPLTSAIVSTENSSAPLFPPALILGLILALSGVLVLLSRARR